MPDLPITLPFPLIDIAAEDERFRFLCMEIHPLFRTPEQKKSTDFDCEFALEYAGRGLSAQFGCDITAGNVWRFISHLKRHISSLIRITRRSLRTTVHLTARRSGFSLTGTAAVC